MIYIILDSCLLCKILDQEEKILVTLDFNLNWVTVYDLLPTVLLSLNLVEPHQKFFALYLSQLVVCWASTFFTYLPSELAMAISMLTAFTFNPLWVYEQQTIIDFVQPLAERVANYIPPFSCMTTPMRLQSCVLDVFKFCSAPPKAVSAARQKFAKTAYCHASSIRLPQTIPLPPAN